MHSYSQILVLLFSLQFASTRLVRAQFKASLSPQEIDYVTKNLHASSASDLSISGDLLKPFLVPRVSDTAGNVAVQNHIKQVLTSFNWQIEEDSFQANTPYGKKSFNNIIATKNPNSLRKLVLAAHYDSKYFKDFDFIGATDSAVPCAILIDIAKNLNSLLEKNAEQTNQNLSLYPTLQLIFFDGEEAFVEWSENDSLYGSKHLADKWANTKVSVDPQTVYSILNGNAAQYGSVLQTIDVLVLLDLLGMKNPIIYNTQVGTSWAWDRLVNIESQLFQKSLLSPQAMSTIEKRGHGYFVPGITQMINSQIDDDHRPFVTRGVPVVHVIPQPFPSVWHSQKDDQTAIDEPTVLNLALIFKLFVIEYLGLSLE